VPHGRGGGATDGASAPTERASHPDAEPVNVTNNSDDSATSSPQVVVPTIDLIAPANDNPPPNDTQSVDVPAAPEPEAPAPEPDVGVEAANDNPPPSEQLPATGTD
jgi:hypothetical protein